MTEFIKLRICKKRVACRHCRNQHENGERFRTRIRRMFSVPEDKLDWECPYGIPWGGNGEGR